MGAQVPTLTSHDHRLRKVTITPTIDTSAYAADDLVGGKLIFQDALFGTRGASGLLQTAQLTDAAQQDATLELLLFDADPTATTFTDNAAFTLAAADIPKLCARVSFSDYLQVGGISVARVENLAAPALTIDGGTLHGALISKGTPTYSSAGNLTLTLTVLAL